MMVVENKTFRYFIPYLGMTVGLMASNIVHEIGHFPHLTECALKRTNCDKAYEAWLDYSFKDKVHQWSPGLISMLVSTAASGFLEMAIRTTGAQIAKLIGAEIVLSISPTGWVARGGRWVYKIAQLAGFVYIDHLIFEPVNSAWQNAVGAGPELHSQSQKLMETIEKKTTLDNLNGNLCPTDRLKRSKENCVQDFANQLFEFNKYLQNWQEFNFTPVMMAHQNWIQYLSQLAMEYHQAKSFYFDFVSDNWKAKAQSADSVDHLIFKRGLLYGVNIEPGTPADLEDRMFRPNWVELKQRQFLSVMLPTFFNSSKIQSLEANLSHLERPLFDEIKKDLLSATDVKVANAISKIRWYLKKDLIANYPSHQSANLFKLLTELSLAIGEKAEPLRAPGELYLRLQEEFKDIQSSRKGLHYLFKQMVFGPEPDLKTNLIKSNLSGFPAEFIAPKIVKNFTSNVYLPEIYKFEAIENQRKLNYMNILVDGVDAGNTFDFVVRSGIRPEILGTTEKTNIHIWWENVVDNQLRNALETYSKKYHDILKLLVSHTLDNKNSYLNRSSFSNNLIETNQQAMDIFLALSYPSKQKVSHSLMPIQEWAKLSLEQAPRHIQELRYALNKLLLEAAESIRSPESQKAKAILANLSEWQQAYQETLDRETGISDRSKGVLKASINSQIERVKLWLQVTQALEAEAFINGEAETPAPRQKCSPMGNGLGLFLRGNCN
jgi:hypothetical protein